MRTESIRDPFLVGKIAGAMTQGLAIGVLLLYIILRMMGSQSAQFLFRYEGF